MTFGSALTRGGGVDPVPVPPPPPPPPSIVRLDDFERTVPPDDWGPSSSGPTWLLYDTPTVSVGGGVGTLDASGGNLAGAFLPSTDPLFPAALRYGHDVDMTYRFRVSAFAVSPDSPDELNVLLFQGALQFFVDPTTEVGWGQLSMRGNSPSTFYYADFTDWAVATWYDLHIAYIGGVAMANLWRSADPEPAGWMLSQVETLNMTGLDDSLMLINAAGDTEAALDFDYIDYVP